MAAPRHHQTFWRKHSLIDSLLVLARPSINNLDSRLAESARCQKHCREILMGCLAVLFGYGVLPLDLSLSPVELYQKWSAGRVNLPFAYQSHLRAQDLYDLVTDVLLWIPVSYLWIASGKKRRMKAWRWTVFAAGVLSQFNYLYLPGPCHRHSYCHARRFHWGVTNRYPQDRSDRTPFAQRLLPDIFGIFRFRCLGIHACCCILVSIRFHIRADFSSRVLQLHFSVRPFMPITLARLFVQ